MVQYSIAKWLLHQNLESQAESEGLQVVYGYPEPDHWLIGKEGLLPQKYVMGYTTSSVTRPHRARPGLGAIMASTPTRTASPPSALSSAQRVSKPQSESRGNARRRRPRRARKAKRGCPKGHYWSYKQKKCVKSKFT